MVYGLSRAGQKVIVLLFALSPGFTAVCDVIAVVCAQLEFILSLWPAVSVFMGMYLPSNGHPLCIVVVLSLGVR